MLNVTFEAGKFKLVVCEVANRDVKGSEVCGSKYAQSKRHESLMRHTTNLNSYLELWNGGPGFSVG
jgi:hypothetical protein